MTMSAGKELFELEGWDRFLKAVQSLPDKQKRSELLKVLRRVAKPTVQAAKAAAPRQDGKLQKSIGVITSRSKTYPSVYAGPRVKGQNAGYHGHLVEFGTGPRRTKDGRFTGSMPAQPYMRPAYEQTKTIAVNLAQTLITKQMQRTIDKYVHK